MRAAVAASWLISRLLRRAAWFLWITPLVAAASSSFAASRTRAVASSTSPAAMVTRAFLTYVRSAVRMGRFLAERRAATRCAFSADFVFAKAFSKR